MTFKVGDEVVYERLDEEAAALLRRVVEFTKDRGPKWDEAAQGAEEELHATQDAVGKTLTIVGVGRNRRFEIEYQGRTLSVNGDCLTAA